MDILTQIERNHFQADEATVEKLAASHYDSASAVTRIAGTYFKILLACAQVTLVGKPVVRLARGAKKPVDTDTQLKALETAHATLYPAVRRGVETPDVEPLEGLLTDEANRRSAERNRRSNYARTSAYALRRYVKAGGDLRRLVVTTATKNGVIEATPSAGGVEEDTRPARIKRAATRLAALAEELASADKPAAEAAVREALSTLMGSLTGMGVKSTDKPEIAVRDQRVLKTPAGTFWPASAVH